MPPTPASTSRIGLIDRIVGVGTVGVIGFPIWFAATVFMLFLGNSFLVLGVQFRDLYVGYTGTVVAKGHGLWLGDAIMGNNDYLAIRDANGREHRHYVSRIDYVMADTGRVVVKQRGFFEHARRPGQLTPYQLLDSAEKVLKRHRADSTR